MVRVGAHPLVVAVALGLLGPGVLSRATRMDLSEVSPEREDDERDDGTDEVAPA